MNDSSPSQPRGFMELGHTQNFLWEPLGLVGKAKVDPSSKPQLEIR